MSKQILGFSPTRVDTDLEHDLGFVVEDGNGNKFMYVQAGGAIGAAVACTLAIGYQATASGNAGKVIGVNSTGVAIADNEYFWMQVGGLAANINVADSLTAGMWLAAITDANGDLLQISATSATTGAHSIRALLLEDTAAGVADVLLFSWL